MSDPLGDIIMNIAIAGAVIGGAMITVATGMAFLSVSGQKDRRRSTSDGGGDYVLVIGDGGATSDGGSCGDGGGGGCD